jgi:hypothetical protein
MRTARREVAKLPAQTRLDLAGATAKQSEVEPVPAPVQLKAGQGSQADIGASVIVGPQLPGES